MQRNIKERERVQLGKDAFLELEALTFWSQLTLIEHYSVHSLSGMLSVVVFHKEGAVFIHTGGLLLSPYYR